MKKKDTMANVICSNVYGRSLQANALEANNGQKRDTLNMKTNFQQMH